MAGKMTVQAGQSLTSFGIPQDVIDAADQLGLDAQTLVQLCIQHTVDAARAWLNALAGKLPGK